MFFAIFLIGFSSANFIWNKIININITNNHYFCTAKIKKINTNANSSKLDAQILSCNNSVEFLEENVLSNSSVSLFYPQQLNNYNAGDLIRFRAKFSKPKDYNNSGSFPYRLWLASNGISLNGSITKDWIIKLKSNSDLSHTIKNDIIKSFESIKNNNVKSFLTSITLGIKDTHSEYIYEIFRNTGIVHILSISGLHVGFVFLITVMFSYLIGYIYPNIFNLIPRQMIATILAIPFIWTYIIISNASVSSLRSGIMLSICLFSILNGYKTHMLSVICLTAFILSSLSPLIIYNISFELSVISVLGIIVVLEKFNIDTKNKLLNYIYTLILISIITISLTSPIVSKYFHEISLMGIFTNLIIIPYTGFLIFPVTFIGAFSSLISTKMGSYILNFAATITSPMIKIVELLNNYSNRFIINLSPTNLEIFGFYIIVTLIIFRNKLGKLKYIFVIIPLLIFIFEFAGTINKSYEAIFFDVGHGDSALIQFSSGQKILIDGGGTKSENYDIGKQVLAPALWNMGIRKIDEIILTHPHLDHYKGLSYIAEKFKPNHIWRNKFDAPENETDEWADFINRVNNANVKTEIIDSNKTLNIGKGKLYIINSPLIESNNLNHNNTSLILIFEENNKRILIAGDLEKDAETELLKMNYNLKADVLKISHHGSITSSSLNFLKTVQPKIAVISTGKDNRYNMPNQTVLNRLSSLGIIIKRTDLDGMIKIKP